MLQIALEELKKNLGATKAQIVFNVGNIQTEKQDSEDNDEIKTIRLERHSQNSED